MTKSSFGFKAYMLVGLARISYLFFWIFSAIFSLIKWSMAPFIFMIQILFLLPFAKFRLVIHQKVDPKSVSEEELTDETWELFQEQKELLEREGFIGTKMIFMDLYDGATRGYTYTMLNEQHKLGMGLNYLMNKDAKGKFTILDTVFMEFTLHCPNGNIVDIHNNSQDILDSIKHRKRYYLRQDDPQRMFQIVQVISQKSGCFTSNESLTALKNNFSKLIKEENEMGLKALQESNVIYKSNDKNRLTWKGAVKILVHSFWPMNVWFEKKKYQESRQYLNNLGIDVQNIPYADYASKEEIFKPITTLKILYDALQEPKLHFGFSLDHKPTSATFYMDENYQIVSMIVHMLETKKHGNKDRYSLSRYEIEFDNIDLQCSYDGYAQKDYYTEHCPFEKPLDNLQQYIDIDKVLKLSQEKLKIEKPEFTTLSLIVDEKKPLWRVYFQKEEMYQDIEIDAKNGEILFEGEVENLYSNSFK